MAAVVRQRPPWFIVFYRSMCVLCVICKYHTPSGHNKIVSSHEQFIPPCCEPVISLRKYHIVHRRYADTHYHRTRRNIFSDVDHCFQMVSTDYFLFFLRILLARRYTDTIRNTQIGIPAFLPLMHASSLK